jgi:transcriptional regulator with XRE-family HTH domain
LEKRQSATATTTLDAGVGRVGGNASQRAATEIRGLMGAQKLNTVDLARLLNVSRDTASRRINGESDLSLNELEAIAAWLGVSASRIIAPATGTTYSE